MYWNFPAWHHRYTDSVSQHSAKATPESQCPLFDERWSRAGQQHEPRQQAQLTEIDSDERAHFNHGQRKKHTPHDSAQRAHDSDREDGPYKVRSHGSVGKG